MLRFTCLLLLATPLAAQSPILVDAAGGPGHHYRSLPAAVAAAPSGAFLRVRAGIYAPFTVAGKALHIRGAGRAATIIELATGPVRVGKVPAGACFTLAEMEIRPRRPTSVPSSPARPPYCALDGGFFRLSAITILSPGGRLLGGPTSVHQGSALEVRDATLFGRGITIRGKSYTSMYTSGHTRFVGLTATHSYLELADCDIRGCPSEADKTLWTTGEAALVLRSAFNLTTVAVLTDTIVLGGRGSSNQALAGISGRGGDGGPGARLTGPSLLLAEGGRITGGSAGVVYVSMGTWPVWGSGGAGVQLDPAAGLRARATSVQGGPSRPPQRGPATTGPGRVMLLGPPSHRPRLDLVRTATSPDAHRLDLTGAPNRALLLLGSTRPARLPLGGLGLNGTLLLDPLAPDFLLLGGLQLDPAGAARLVLPAFPHARVLGPYWLQALMAPDGGQMITSNPACWTAWP